MKNSEEILNELKEISPLLAGFEKVNVFKVPDGYFDGLELGITDYVMLSNISTVQNIDKKKLQDVPADYFDNLSNSIMSKIRSAYPENFEEETVSDLLQKIKGVNPFSVPSGYFDSLSDSLIDKINTIENSHKEETEHSFLFNEVKNINVFTVPENYFDNLSNSITKKISANENADEEIRAISPLLYSIKGENVFTVPYGYFSSLADNIIEKAKPAPAKVIQINRKRSWMRYAVAAAITGVITFGSIKLFNSFNKQLPPLAANLSKEIQESKQYKTETDIDDAIAKLDDAEIAKYLEKGGNVMMDNNLLMSNTDESELPDPNDYLLSDSTLNNYLDKININTDKLTP